MSYKPKDFSQSPAFGKRWNHLFDEMRRFINWANKNGVPCESVSCVRDKTGWTGRIEHGKETP